jgi:exodeoxyribonuclease-5
MFTGDTAQLPPVGLDLSPALDPAFLKARYSRQVMEHELTGVVRQEAMSGILLNATRLRNSLLDREPQPLRFITGNEGDVVQPGPGDLEEHLTGCFHSDDLEDAVVVTRSNKRANLYNQAIRSRILGREEDINAGDRMMVVKNNYFWLEEASEAGFIANGDLLQLRHISNRRKVFGFDFADAAFAMCDYPDQDTMDARLILDTIVSDSPSLGENDSNRLFNELLAEYADMGGRNRQVAAVMNDPYFNALQVKFAYALTCHKTQGGQWKNVFIDGSFIRTPAPDRETVRWLYTALTRATGKVFLVNFEKGFFQ